MENHLFQCKGIRNKNGVLWGHKFFELLKNLKTCWFYTLVLRMITSSNYDYYHYKFFSFLFYLVNYFFLPFRFDYNIRKLTWKNMKHLESLEVSIMLHCTCENWPILAWLLCFAVLGEKSPVDLYSIFDSNCCNAEWASRWLRLQSFSLFKEWTCYLFCALDKATCHICLEPWLFLEKFSLE